jgi:hypothetical protein
VHEALDGAGQAGQVRGRALVRRAEVDQDGRDRGPAVGDRAARAPAVRRGQLRALRGAHDDK